MFSCLSSFMREISRMAVEGVPSSRSRWISLRATMSLLRRERPYMNEKLLFSGEEDVRERKEGDLEHGRIGS